MFCVFFSFLFFFFIYKDVGLFYIFLFCSRLPLEKKKTCLAAKNNVSGVVGLHLQHPLFVGLAVVALWRVRWGRRIWKVQVSCQRDGTVGFRLRLRD
jgi:hypothetical protein